MNCKKEFFRVGANSILESVIALTIISVCLYIAVVIYALVFTPKTAPKFYISRNKADELFFMRQLQSDSLSELLGKELNIEEELLNYNLKQIIVSATDSSQIISGNTYFILER